MGRMVINDSEGEFPDLDDLLKSKPATYRTEPAQRPKPIPARRKATPLELELNGVSVTGTNDSEVNKVLCGVRREKDTVKASVKKKRVLKQRNDNPLLRPIGRLEYRAENHSMVIGSEGKSSGVDDLKERRRVLKKASENTILQSQSEGIGADTATSDLRGEKHDSVAKYKTAVGKTPSKCPPLPDSQDLENEEDSTLDFDDTDGLSDFVVNDSDSLEDENSMAELTPPRSTRRLVRGRRGKGKIDAELELEMGKLNLKDSNLADPFTEPKKDGYRNIPDSSHSEKEDQRPQKKSWESSRLKTEAQESRKKMFEPSSDIEEPFLLRFSPSENKSRKVSKQKTFSTSPGNPSTKPKSLASPKKIQRIPSTPHRPSMDSFWAQDVINDWNDEFSPKKTPRAFNAHFVESTKSPKKSPTKVVRLEKEAKKAFSARKHEIAESFLQELDTTITKGEISSLSASTGGIQLVWSKKLSTTAGRANWKRETIRSSSSDTEGKPIITYRHHAAIELAEKVIDDEDRLLNVIAHEFCHLANFMISGVKTNPHGKEFKVWAQKVSATFGHRGINVTTKHSYEIDYKYVWECENCGVEFKRHSKSVDTTRHRCGVCKGLLVQTKPVPRGGKDGEKGALSEYQAFVKENMKIVRRENPTSPQKEIMGLVGKRYKQFKAARAEERVEIEKEIVAVGIKEVVSSRDSTPVEEDGVGDVVRKLDFLDLTSP